MADALGLVAGTVPATPLKYSVSLAPGQYAQLDDVNIEILGHHTPVADLQLTRVT